MTGARRFFSLTVLAGLLTTSAAAVTVPHARCVRGCRAAHHREGLPPRLGLDRQGAEVDLSPGEDLYAIVGVLPTASAAEIRAAYRRRASIIHPDVNDAADAPRDFRRLSAAAAILLSPQRDIWTTEGVAEWPTDVQGAQPPAEGSDGWLADAKNYGPLWSAVIAPWLSWYVFVAIDTWS